MRRDFRDIAGSWTKIPLSVAIGRLAVVENDPECNRIHAASPARVASVKWLTDIEVLDCSFKGHFHTRAIPLRMVVVVAHRPDELSIQLRGQWLNPGARLAICLRFAFVSRIAVEDKASGLQAKTSGFPVYSAGIRLNSQAAEPGA
jgi:hypothetical protein